MIKGTKKEETKARIIEAAKEHFVQNGFKDTLVINIAKDCDLDRRTIYRYFPTKEALLIHITSNMFDEFTTMAINLSLNEEENAYLRLEKLFHFCYDYVKNKPEIMVLLGMLDTNVGNSEYDLEEFSTLNRYGRILDELVSDIIQEGQDSGILKTNYTPHEYALTINNALLAQGTRTAIYSPGVLLKHEGPVWNVLQIQIDMLLGSLLK